MTGWSGAFWKGSFRVFNSASTNCSMAATNPARDELIPYPPAIEQCDCSIAGG